MSKIKIDKIGEGIGVSVLELEVGKFYAIYASGMCYGICTPGKLREGLVLFNRVKDDNYVDCVTEKDIDDIEQIWESANYIEVDVKLKLNWKNK